MTETTERWDRLDRMIAEGRIVRREWGDGRERACLLLALAPEVGSEGLVSRCPADALPAWLAELTPWIDDAGSKALWPGVLARYALVTRRAHGVLDADGWERARCGALTAIVSEARSHVAAVGAALPAIDGVLALLSRGEAGDAPTREEWARAAWAAWAAAWPAAAARAAAEAEAAAWAAEAAWAAWAAARARAAAEAADRMIAGILDAIERQCARMEAT